MTRRSPGHAARIARRAMERAARGEQRMNIPSRIAALAPPVTRRPPCPIDPDCQVDHLKRKGRRRG